MLLLRLLLAWLIIAAIPVQGFAAASMAFCKGSHRAPAASASAHDRADQQALDKAGEANSLPDSAHKCGVCAFCCHSIAMAEVSRWPAVASIPQPEPAEGVLRIDAALPELPDKPPRA